MKLNKILSQIIIIQFMVSQCIGQIISPTKLSYDSLIVDTFSIDTLHLKIGKNYFLKGNKILRQTYYLNGQISGQFEFKNKCVDYMWDSTGVLIYKCEKKNGKKNGDMICWYSDGIVEAKGKFHSGDGEIRHYYPSGELERIEKEKQLGLVYAENYCKNGALISKVDYTISEYYSEEYYCNGNIKQKGRIVNGFREGPWNFYSEDGNLLSQEHYESGKLISKEDF